MNQLKVTILLPVYNGTKWIEKSIRSALRQSFSDFELIILNDCSTDDTERVVFSFMSQDKRIVYIRNDKNLGLAKTLNVGLGTAKGEYIARLDADDEWIDVDKLKKQVSLLDKYPEYTLVGTGAVVVDENGQEITRYLMPKTDSQIRRKILRMNCFIHTSVLFRSKAVKEIGGYLHEKILEDHDLWLRLGRVGKFANLPEYSVKYLFHTKGVNSQNKILRLRQNVRLANENKAFYPNYLFAVLLSWAKIILLPIFNLVPRSLKGALLKIHKKI